MSHAVIDALIAKRANAWNQAQEVLDAVEASEDKAFSAEQDQTWQRANDEIDALDARIKAIKSAEKRASEAEKVAEEFGARPTTATANGSKPAMDQRTADYQRLRKLISGETRAMEFKPEKRDLTVGTDSQGGFTVPTGFYGQLVEHMIENSAIRQTNVTVVTTDSGNDLQVPKTTTHPTAAIVAEGVAPSESDTVFAQVTLQAYKYGFLTQLSAELEQDTGVDLVGYLARIGGEALGNGSGAHFITGTGTGQPNGVVTASTLGVTGGAGVSGAFTADELIELFYSVIAPYRRNGSWLMSDAGIRTARQLKGSDNNYLWQPGLQAADPDLLLGRPVVSDTNIADPALSAKSVVFGDMSRYFIRDVAGVRIERSTDFAFDTDLVTWRFLARTDGDLIDTTGAVKHFIGNAA